MFKPWRGSQYEDESNIVSGRLLILGESHYTKNAALVGSTQDGFTEEVVRYQAISRRHHFFGKLQEVITGVPRKLHTPSSKEAFWEAVAFYNYVPVLVDGRDIADGGARRRPTVAMFQAGATPFLQTLSCLEPKAVIVCGITLWDYVAPNLQDFGPADRNVVFYDDGQRVFARIEHPSTPGFDTTKWYHRIHYLLELAAAPRQSGKKIMWQDWNRS